MRRRHFLSLVGLGTPALLRAQRGPAREEPVEKLTPGPSPTIALNHLGFLPKSPKILVVRASRPVAPAEFTLRDIGQPPKPFRFTRPLKRTASDFGDCLAGDFSDLQREALYQVRVGAELSAPFFVRPDLWRRTLPKAVGYYRHQRCGVEVPGVHPACHLDDARRRDNGQHVDVTGGWHDAGDLRKWMGTMLNGIALLRLARNLGDRWDPAGSGVAPLLEEVRWGNRYFLKMQDTDGRIWNDTAGGVNGDNSDNHWTDNQVGTEDDRYINSAKSGEHSALFAMLQAMVSQAFRQADPAYGKDCLAAGLRAWEASPRSDSARELSWWTLAALELHRATGRPRFRESAVSLGRQLLELQNTDFIGSQRLIRGFWRTSPKDASPYSQATYSALPPLALLELAVAFPSHPDAARWRDAVRLHLEEYVLPMSARSAYRNIPFGVFVGSPTPEHYRPLAGELTYRYFMPVRQQFWWLGLTAHLECYALLLATASRTFEQGSYRDLAYRQMEWVTGANPFGACLMTGEGLRNPYPHSRFVGLIPGGIMNGIAGNTGDEPVLDTENGFDWRTTEYWSPHNAFYIWALSVLESA